MNQPTLWVFTPCYYDYAPFTQLESAVRTVLASHYPHNPLQVVLIDDSAGQDLAIDRTSNHHRVVTPPRNLGHQGALVYALRQLAAQVAPSDYVVTMDSDGEDNPSDIPALLEPLMHDASDLSAVSVAQRTKRHETMLFKLGYVLFKGVFRLLTGTIIRSGNFVAYRGWVLQHAIWHPFFDYCYSSSLIRLQLVTHNIPLARAPRYHGVSKMQGFKLVHHALAMFLPFCGVVTSRASILSAGVTIFGVMTLAIFYKKDPSIAPYVLMLMLLYYFVILLICGALYVMRYKKRVAYLSAFEEVRR